MNAVDIIIRPLRHRDYVETWQAMRALTAARDDQTLDEIWLLEHPPVYTQGQAGKPEHIFNPGNIPVIAVDRGGQVTYHGPGQLVVYFMLDIQRRHVSTRDLVHKIEQSVIALLAEYGISASTRQAAPGVYVTASNVVAANSQQGAKICSIGLRIRQGRSYHGIALNVDMDLTPFAGINPCGYQGMQMTDIARCAKAKSLSDVAQALMPHLLNNLGYTSAHFADDWELPIIHSIEN